MINQKTQQGLNKMNYRNFVATFMSSIVQNQSFEYALMHGTLMLKNETVEAERELASSNGNLEAIASELGDVMFSLTHLENILGLDGTEGFCSVDKDFLDLVEYLCDRVEKYCRGEVCNSPSRALRLKNEIVQTVIELKTDISDRWSILSPEDSIEEIQELNFKKLSRRALSAKGKTAYLIGGYARTGKTTLQKGIESLGYTTFSTSDYIHYKTMEKFGLDLIGDKYILENKLDDIFKAKTGLDMTVREACIYTAENPADGVAGKDRLKFADTAVRYLIENVQSETSPAFIFTFNIEESEGIKTTLKSLGYEDIITINLLADVDKVEDGRELLPNPDTTFWNSLISPAKTLYDFFNEVRSFQLNR